MRCFFLTAAVASLLTVSGLSFADEEDEDVSSEEDASDNDEDTYPKKKKRSDDDDDDDDEPKSKRSKSDDSDDEDAKADGGKKLTWGHDGKVSTEPNPEAMSSEHRWDVHLLDFMTFSVGFLGGAGGNFLDKPGDQSVQGFENVDPEYPGFAGLMTSIGPTFEVRFLGYAGIELDVLVQRDTGSADLKVTQTSGGQITSQNFTVELQQSAVHVPLLFKGAIPGRIVTPVLFLGPEFVFVNESSAEITDGSVPAFHGVDYTAKNPDSYTAFMFGLGLEFNLPIPYVDVRIPFNLRGMVNPGVSDKREERADFGGTAPDNITSVAFSTEWKFQAMGNIGLSVHF